MADLDAFDTPLISANWEIIRLSHEHNKVSGESKTSRTSSCCVQPCKGRHLQCGEDDRNVANFANINFFWSNNFFLINFFLKNFFFKTFFAQN